MGHTLNPFNGLMAVPLLPFLGLLQAHNFAVVFAFVVSGYTAFLLAWRFTRAYLPSLVAGAMFTFSNYHFAHAEGHLQLVSMQWIPLFALLWWMLLEKPRPLLGVGTGVALFLVALCDYYYLFFSVIFGVLAFLWRGWRARRVPLLGSRAETISLGAFLATALLTTGPMVGGLVLLSVRDPLWGAHPTAGPLPGPAGPLHPGGPLAILGVDPLLLGQPAGGGPREQRPHRSLRHDSPGLPGSEAPGSRPRRRTVGPW